MLDIVNSDNIMPYITRIAYEKLKCFLDKEGKYYLDLNGILWERDIFFENKDKFKQIKVQDNYGVYELEYYDRRLFFIIDITPWNNRIRVFFVNCLRLETFYEGHKNEAILKYKYSTRNHVDHYIYVDNKKYNAIHVGNAYNTYEGFKVSNLNTTESMFWEDIKKFYRGDETNFRFTSSFIGDFMIVHSVNKIL